MLTVGLTGNAGSGKTTVADVWRERGVHVIDADQLAREVVDRDRDLRRALAIEFGEQVLEPSAGAETGAVIRDELARRAFASPERRQALNRIVHPPLEALLRDRLAEARKSKAHLVAVDAALIFELGARDLFDVLVLVTAAPETRLARLRERGLDEATIPGLMAGQMPDAAKTALADRVLVNEGSLAELRAAAAEALEWLLSISPHPADHAPTPTSSTAPSTARPWPEPSTPPHSAPGASG